MDSRLLQVWIVLLLVTGMAGVAAADEDDEIDDGLAELRRVAVEGLPEESADLEDLTTLEFDVERADDRPTILAHSPVSGPMQQRAKVAEHLEAGREELADCLSEAFREEDQEKSGVFVVDVDEEGSVADVETRESHLGKDIEGCFSARLERTSLDASGEDAMVLVGVVAGRLRGTEPVPKAGEPSGQAGRAQGRVYGGMGLGKKQKGRTESGDDNREGPADQADADREKAGKPLVEASAVRVDGPLEEEKVEETVDRKSNTFTYCYEKEVMTDPELSGEAIFTWTISTKGIPTDIEVESSSIDSEAVADCVVRGVERMRFEEPDGEEVEVEYEVRFETI